jgi:hypothetical protein
MIDGEEREFQSPEEIQSFFRGAVESERDQMLEAERTKFAGEMDALKGRYAELEEVGRIVQQYPEARDAVLDVWQKTQGGQIPYPQQQAPAGPQASPLDAFDTVDEFDALRNLTKSALIERDARMAQMQADYEQRLSMLMPAVAAVTQRQSAEEVVTKYYSVMDEVKADPRFKNLPEDAWKDVDEVVTEQNVTEDHFRATIEREAVRIAKYANAATQRPGVNLQNLPGPLPFPKGGSAAMGSQEGPPKTREEFQERVKNALLSGGQFTMEGP